MNVQLVWATLSFWLGLLTPYLTSKLLLALLISISFAIYLLGLSHFFKARYLLLFLMAMTRLPKPSELSYLPKWHPTYIRFEVLQADPLPGALALRLHCRLLSALNDHQQPIVPLHGQLFYLKLSGLQLRSPIWEGLAAYRVTASLRLRVKALSIEPCMKITLQRKLRLISLNASLKLRDHLLRVTQKEPAMGRNLILSMLGVTRPMPRTDYLLGRMGLRHLTAVSGLHFTLIALCIGFLTSFLNPRWRLLASGAGISLFLILIGPTASSLRAWSMSWIALICLFTARGYIALHSLCLTSMLWLFVYPQFAVNRGFILSVLCTALLIGAHSLCRNQENQIERDRRLASRGCERWKARLLNTCYHGVIVQSMLWLMTAPLQSYWFHQLSWLSLITNLLITPLLALAFTSTLIATLLSCCLPLCGHYLLCLTCRATDRLLQLLSLLPHQLDQIYYIELSSLQLALIFPWFVVFCIKLHLATERKLESV